MSFNAYSRDQLKEILARNWDLDSSAGFDVHWAVMISNFRLFHVVSTSQAYFTTGSPLTHGDQGWPQTSPGWHLSQVKRLRAQQALDAFQDKDLLSAQLFFLGVVGYIPQKPLNQWIGIRLKRDVEKRFLLTCWNPLFIFFPHHFLLRVSYKKNHSNRVWDWSECELSRKEGYRHRVDHISSRNWEHQLVDSVWINDFRTATNAIYVATATPTYRLQ